MPLPIKTFEQIVSDQVTAIQAASSELTDFTIGSILRSIVESNAANSLWIQAIMINLLAVTRLTTSSGEDVDSFVNPFGFVRDPATQAFGNITFARFSSAIQAIIPAQISTQAGAQVSAPSISQTYMVVPDTTNINYNSTLNAYVIPIGTASIQALVQANIAGSAGNASVGLINTINSVIVGVDTVNNSSPIQNGEDAESDQAVKNRFPLFLAALSKSTKIALSTAIEAIPAVTRYTLVQNINYTTGNPLLGQFWAVIDDGSGSPPSPLIDEVRNALYATGAFTIRLAVYGPTVTTVPISVDVLVPDGTDESIIATEIQTILINYINALPFAAVLRYTKIIELIYEADPLISNVTNLLVNGGTSDLIANNKTIFMTNSNIIAVGFPS